MDESSLKIALELGYNKELIQFIENNISLKIINSLPPQGFWYGFCSFKPLFIEVYNRNLSTEDDRTIIQALKYKGMPQSMVKELLRIKELLGNDFFEIYNQSGMDHEVIGHLYNHLAKLGHDENAAVHTQIEFAKIRSAGAKGNSWKLVLGIMPKVLGYHKGIDELK